MSDTLDPVLTAEHATTDTRRSDVPASPRPGPGPDRHPAVVEGRHAVRVRRHERTRRAIRRRRPREWAGVLVCWGVLWAVFAAIGMIVAIRYGAVPGDALSRVQAARGMITGRDPHPEAIGFVWGPFPTLFEVPVVWFARWWLPLSSTGLAAVVVSAAAVATIALQLFGWGRDLGARTWICIAAVALTLAHPLVWTAAVNGMSEGVWLLMLVIAGRHLTRWLDTDDAVSLGVVSVALGLAYLTRYETLAAIVAVTALVGLVSYRTARVELLVPPEHRSLREIVPSLVDHSARRAAALDMVMVALPAAAAVGIWSLFSWAIVGEPFPQLSSEYGNSAIVDAASGSIEAIVGDVSATGRTWFFLHQLVVSCLVVVPLLAIAAWWSGRAAWRSACGIAIFAAPIAAQFVLSAQGSTFPWFRYVVSGVVLAGALLVIIDAELRSTRTGRWLVPLCALALVPGIVMSSTAAASGQLGSLDDEPVIGAVTAALRGREPDRSASYSVRGDEVARYIDSIDTAVPGAVLTDTSSTFPVVAAAPRPELYIVPGDRDFEQVVADPQRFGVRFILLRGRGAAGDAVSASFPDLWSGRNPLATTVATWGSDGDPAGHYRLLEVTDPTIDPRPTPDTDLTGS